MVVAEKRSRVIKMLEEQGLVRDGLIDGIGIQAHWKLDWPSLDAIESAIIAFSQLGLDVEITELDIDNPEQNQAADPKNDAGLADRYGEIFAIFRKHASHISGVTFWGIADDHTWLTEPDGAPSYPLLWDEGHAPKAAYYRVRDF